MIVTKRKLVFIYQSLHVHISILQSQNGILLMPVSNGFNAFITILVLYEK